MVEACIQESRLQILCHLQWVTSSKVGLGVGIQLADGWRDRLKDWVRVFHRLEKVSSTHIP